MKIFVHLHLAKIFLEILFEKYFFFLRNIPDKSEYKNTHFKFRNLFSKIIPFMR